MSADNPGRGATITLTLIGEEAPPCFRHTIDPVPAVEVSSAEFTELADRLTLAGHFATANCAVDVAATFYSAAALALMIGTDTGPCSRRLEYE